MEITTEMCKTAQNYDREYLEKLKDIKTGLQMMVINKSFDTDVGVLEIPVGIVNIQAILNTGLAEEPDYYLNKRPPNILHYLNYDSYRGVLKISNTGMPLWYQLEGEASIFYNMFETYRDLMQINGTRRDYKTIAELFQIKIAKVGRVAEIYHWDLRIKAFEHFQEITRMRVRKEEAFAMETRHSKDAMDYIQIVMDRIRAFTEDDLERINPKNAVEILKQLQEMERLSRGIDPKNVSKLTSPTTKVEKQEEKQLQGGVTINQINGGNGFISEVKSDEEKEKEEEVLRKKLQRAKDITQIINQITPSDEESEEENKEAKEKLDETIKDLKRKKRKKEKEREDN